MLASPLTAGHKHLLLLLLPVNACVDNEGGQQQQQTLLTYDKKWSIDFPSWELTQLAFKFLSADVARGH